jgi:membrane protease YdiL (CAAX protease family)
VLILVAVVGLAFSERGILAAIAPRDGFLEALLVGAASGAGCVAVLWSLRKAPALRDLERWQRELVSEWTNTDAVVVALVSGIAEEVLLRAFLQPVIGLVPAAVLFAVLHLVPDRRLWSWPVFALGCGLVLGVLFDRYGYPAAAAAHVVINLVALLRLRRPAPE